MSSAGTSKGSAPAVDSPYRGSSNAKQSCHRVIRFRLTSGKAIDSRILSIVYCAPMRIKHKHIFLATLVAFLLTAVAYGQCHLLVAHSDSGAEQNERLLECAKAHLTSSSGNNLYRRSGGGARCIDFISAVVGQSRILFVSAPFRDAVSAPPRLVHPLYLWVGVLRI